MKALLLIIFFCAKLPLTAQMTYFNLQFDYQNRLETTGLTSVETDSFYIIPSKGASPFQSVADTSFVLKINKFNNQIDYKKIDYFEGQAVTAVLIKSDSTLVIQGTNYLGPKEYNIDNNLYMAILDKTTLNDMLIKEYGLTGRIDVFVRPVLTSDGGIFSSGWSFPVNPLGNASLVCFKCDSNLNQQFLKTFPPNAELNKNYLGSGVVESPDKGFIIVGTKHIVQGFLSNALVIKVDSVCNQIFWKEIPNQGDTTNLSLSDIQPNINGTYIAVGQRVYNPQVGPGWERSWVVGLDNQGNVLWSKSYAENERSGWESIVPSLDGNFYVCGYERDWADTPQYLQYATIGKVSPDGELIWYRKYTVEPSGKHYDIFYNVQATSDGGILCTGTTYGGDTMRQNAWIVKLDGNGCISPDQLGCVSDIDEPIVLPVGQNSWITLSPNPTTGLVRLTAKEDHRIEYLRVYDTTGRLVEERPADRAVELFCDLSSQKAGMYVFSVLVDGVWTVRQVVKQ